VGVTSIGAVAAAVTLNGKGEEDGYGIIIKKGDVEGDADPFRRCGDGVIMTSGVDDGVSNAVGVEEGYGTQ
jgi:hypothetical protein